MRALLVVNPKATATTPRVRDVLAHALASDLKIDVCETSHRGHATELAQEAARDGVSLVVVLGGDGTVNEVVNGLMSVDGAGAHRTPDGLATALAVVPGGSTNVFTRALGMPTDPVEATSELLAALRAGRHRRIGLGQADGRWFTFCAGLGLDAEAVRRVEHRRAAGKPATAARYVRCAVASYLRETDHRRPALTLHVAGAEPVGGLFMAIVTNTAPWTWYGERPVNPTPHSSFDSGLDLYARTRMGLVGSLWTVGQWFRSTPRFSPRSTVTLADLPVLELRADRPVALQVDGDYLGEVESLRLQSRPDALSVVV